LDKNTLVIFVSDNGAPFLNSKTTLYDAGVRLPLLVCQPGGKQGVTNPNMVSFLDVLLTSIEWAGIQNGDVKTPLTGMSPPRLGNPFLSILGASELLSADQWKQHVFGSHTFHEVQNYWPTRFMRNHQFKYHRNIAWRLEFPFATDLYISLSWEGLRNASKVAEAECPSDTPEVMIGRRRLQNYIFRGPEELFDLENDPEELNNLAADPEFDSVLKEMRHTLENWQHDTSDMWLLRDGVSVLTTEKAQGMGLNLPDRFDFDVKNPWNTVGPHWVLRMSKPSALSLDGK
jgi:N-sulfoglucosamine sulfohydrolase